MENENQVNEQAEQKKFCKHCGKQINATATFCTHCGKSQTATASAPKAQPQQPAQPVVQVEQKSKLVAGLLAIFLGTLGIHNFYLGNTQKAVLQLVITIIAGWIGVGLIVTQVWALIEAIQLFTGSIKVDGKGVPLKD